MSIELDVFMNFRTKNEMEEYVRKLTWDQCLNHLKSVNEYIRYPTKIERKPGGFSKAVERNFKLNTIKPILEKKIINLRKLKSRTNRTADTRRYPFGRKKKKSKHRSSKNKKKYKKGKKTKKNKKSKKK
jgi:hypothetical protein